MEEKIVVIKEITEKFTRNDKPYRVITIADGQSYNIWDNEVNLTVGGAYALMGEQSGKYWNVSAVKPVEDKFVEKAAQEVAAKMPDNPQELGMWWKELGECIRAGYITEPGMVLAYKAQMISVLPITIEKKK